MKQHCLKNLARTLKFNSIYCTVYKFLNEVLQTSELLNQIKYLISFSEKIIANLYNL